MNSLAALEGLIVHCLTLLQLDNSASGPDVKDTEHTAWEQFGCSANNRPAYVLCRYCWVMPTPKPSWGQGDCRLWHKISFHYELAFVCPEWCVSLSQRWWWGTQLMSLWRLLHHRSQCTALIVSVWVHVEVWAMSVNWGSGHTFVAPAKQTPNKKQTKDVYLKTKKTERALCWSILRSPKEPRLFHLPNMRLELVLQYLSNTNLN